jgi:diadenosine tetraphosphatase ApaH/serine/threonine PP2A family protein phosphatase
VISDVHANGVALDAVLRSIDDYAVDEVWCLGDTVGYGPRPNETTTVVRERADVALVGNHDLVALGAPGVSAAEFNPDAAAAARWTQEELTADSRAFLLSLAPTARRPGVSLFHASATDPVWDYVLTIEDARRTLDLTDDPVVLVGHTHVPVAITGDGAAASGAHAPGGHTVDLASGRWLLNPGSVGQPRDADPRAAYLLLDLGAGRAEFRRVEYPIDDTQAQMREAGLPAALAQRLAYGV